MDLLPILIMWTHAVMVPALPADGFEVWAGHGGGMMAPILDVGDVRQYALTPHRIEEALGDTVNVDVAVSAYVKTWLTFTIDSDLSNVKTWRVWGADLNRTGLVHQADLWLFLYCYHRVHGMEHFHCRLADYDDNGSVNVPDWLSFAGAYMAAQKRQEKSSLGGTFLYR